MIRPAGIGAAPYRPTHTAPTYSAGHWLPPTDDTYDLGSSSLQWRRLYLGDAVYFGEGAAPAGSNVYIVRDNSGDLTLNALIGKTINLAVDGSDLAQLSATALALQPDVLLQIGTNPEADAYINVKRTDTTGKNLGIEIKSNTGVTTFKAQCNDYGVYIGVLKLTSGGIETSSGNLTLNPAGAIVASSKSITAIGNAGSQLLADAWTMTSANTQILSLTTTGATASAYINTTIPAAGTGAAYLRFIQGAGSGDADNQKYTIYYEGNLSLFRLQSESVGPVSTAGVIIEIADDTNDVKFAGGISTDGVAAPTAGIVSTLPAAAAATNVSSNGGVLQTDTSSLRYKENVADYALGTDLLRLLQPRTFDWRRGISAQDHFRHDHGFIAEEVWEVAPHLVILDKENRPDALRYDLFAVPLVKGWQEHEERIAAIEKVLKAC